MRYQRSFVMLFEFLFLSKALSLNWTATVLYCTVHVPFVGFLFHQLVVFVTAATVVTVGSTQQLLVQIIGYSCSCVVVAIISRDPLHGHYYGNSFRVC